eukprot:437577-Pelagomonas_calceolata.AAC.1
MQIVGSFLNKQHQSGSIISGKAKGTSKGNGRLQDVQVTPASFLQQGKSDGVSNSEQISIANHFFLNGLKL